MKLQRIYYYNNLIPIILQSIIMKKCETIIYYNENNFGQVIATIYGSCYYFNIEGSKKKKQNKTKQKPKRASRRYGF